jgi:flagellar hook-associated protein 3 FlgL
MRYAEVQKNLAKLSARHAAAAREAASGVRVGAPSDDPIAAAELARLRASQSRSEANLNAIRSVRGDAELTEQALADAGDITVRLTEIALQGSSGGLNTEDRQRLALEVSQLKEALVGLGNTKGTRGYLFAGSQTDTPAFDASGNFLGDDVDHLVSIGNSSATAVSTSGADAFAVAGGRNVFADVDALESALNAGDPVATAAALTGIQASHAQLVNARARSGLIVSKLDTSQSLLDALDLEQQQRAASVGAADPFAAFSRVTELGQSLERAVSVSRQILDIGGLNRF